MEKDKTKRNYWLYVLKLEHDKYYVGITSKTPEHRFTQHTEGFLAAKWTKLHKPLSIAHSEELGLMTKRRAEYVENITIRKYMKDLGQNNVRGGDVSTTHHLVKTPWGYYYSLFGWKPLIAVLVLILINVLQTIYIVYLQHI